MGKISNIGRGTSKANEGLIVDGTACHPDGSDSDYSLVVTGSQIIDASGGGGLTIFKEESDSAFLRFINSDDPSSWYAYFAFDSAENIYLFPGRSQDFNVRTRTNVSNDPIKFPFRIYNNGKAKFEHGQSDTAAAAAALPDDVVFFVSGSGDGQNNAVFGGNLVVSGTITGRYESMIPGNAIMFKNTEYYFLTTDDDVNSKIMAPDENIFFSGSIGSRGTLTKGTAVFGGDVVISGSLSDGAGNVYSTGGGGTSKHFATGHCDLQISNKPVNWINAASVSSSAAEKTWFIVPFASTLDKVIVTVKANNFSTANDGNISLNVYKNQSNFGSTIVSQTVGADDFTEKVSNMNGNQDCNQKIFSGLNQSLAEGDLIQMKVSKSAGADYEALVTMVFIG